MGIFDFLADLAIFRRLSFQQHPDSFATTRDTLYANLMRVLNRLIDQERSAESKSNLGGSAIFLAAHFPEEFFRLQAKLDEENIAYRILTRPLDHQWYVDFERESEGVIFLALAEFLTQTTFTGNETFKSRLDLIVVDRHPEPSQDEALEKFGREFPAVTQMGYFLALEDRVLQSVINETTLMVLKQMGIEDQGLISSRIISKRISKVLKREQNARIGEGQAADSAELWYRLNGEN